MHTVPPLPPTNLQVSDVSNRTATLTWQAPVVTFLNSLTAVSSYQVMATQEQFANVSDIYVNVNGVTTYTFPQTLEVVHSVYLHHQGKKCIWTRKCNSSSYIQDSANRYVHKLMKYKGISPRSFPHSSVITTTVG